MTNSTPRNHLTVYSNASLERLAEVHEVDKDFRLKNELFFSCNIRSRNILKLGNT